MLKSPLQPHNLFTSEEILVLDVSDKSDNLNDCLVAFHTTKVSERDIFPKPNQQTKKKRIRNPLNEKRSEPLVFTDLLLSAH